MRAVLCGATAAGIVALVVGFDAVSSRQNVLPPSGVWTQIGHGLAADLLGGSHAQSGRALQAAWRRDGRQGNQHILWVGTHFGGLWKSIVNEGGDITSWVPLTDNFPGPHELGSFLVHRLDSDKVLIGPGAFDGKGGDGYIYRTHDQGATWHAHTLSTLKPAWTVRLVEDRADANGNTVLAATAKGIYRSVDFGINWDPVWNGAAVSDIVQDAADPAIWYAAVVRPAPDVILRSPNHGETWEGMPVGTGDITGTVGRISLATCASNAQVLYALVVTKTPDDKDGALNGLYRSVDRGRNWTKIFHNNDAVNDDNQGRHTCALGCDPADASHVFFGLAYPLETFTALLPPPLITWRGLNGHHRSTLDAGHADFNGVLFRPGFQSIVIANDGGVYIYHPHAGGSEPPSVDDSLNLLGIEANWQRSPDGLAASRSNPDIFLAGLQDDGVAVGDVGANVIRRVLGGDGGQGSIMPDNPLIMAASTNSDTGKFVSFNMGLTWSDISDGLEQQKFASVLIDPTPGVDFPLIFTSKLLNADGTRSQVVFRPLDPHFVPVWLPVSPDVLGGTINHLDHTTDKDVHQIVLTLADHRRLLSFAGTRTQIGDYVRRVITPPLEPLVEGGIRDAHANADKSVLQPDTLYYTTSASRPSQAFISTDGGQTWLEVTGNMPTGKKAPDFVKLLANPRNLDQLFLATTRGVFRSDTRDENGPVWQPYSEGLRENEEIQDIVINVHGLDQPTLYIATKGRGFWKRTVQ